MAEKQDQPGDHRGGWLRDVPPLMQALAVLVTAIVTGVIAILTYLGTRADPPAAGLIDQPADGYTSSERDVEIAGTAAPGRITHPPEGLISSERDVEIEGTAAPRADMLWLIVEPNHGAWYPQWRVRPGEDGRWRGTAAIGPLDPLPGGELLDHTVLLVEVTAEAGRALDSVRGAAEGMRALVDGVHELDSIVVTRSQS